VIHIFLVPAALAALIGVHLAILWRQKHTQFPGPGRTETNVVGSKLWPTYAAKSVGLFCAIAAVLGALGGLAQINPIWLYGPFQASQVSTPAQPDWYLGWLEGALRLSPAVEIRAFGHTVANPFFPAVLLPGLTFALLYAWPFLEQRFSRDRVPHDLLDRARDHPLRTAIGAGALAFYFLLFLAGSNDVLAKLTKVPVSTITSVLRILVLALPIVVGVVVHRLMAAWKGTGEDSFLRVPLRAVVSMGREGGSERSPDREPVAPEGARE
jgi:ubiquinol-cytochrome c reductase cytochrome b subunit